MINLQSARPLIALLPILALALLTTPALANSPGAWDPRFFLPGIQGAVRAVTHHNSSVIAAGAFLAADDQAVTNVARWDGIAWMGLGGGVHGVPNPLVRFRPPPVSALALDGDKVFVGDDFAFAGSVPATNIACWTGGSWTGLGSGLQAGAGLAPPPAVSALWVQGNQLVAGGSFNRAGPERTPGIACWSDNLWSSLGDGMTASPGTPASVRAMAMAEDMLYVGGRFDFAGESPASNVGIRHGPPRLRIARSEAGAVILAWPALPGGFRP